MKKHGDQTSKRGIIAAVSLAAIAAVAASLLAQAPAQAVAVSNLTSVLAVASEANASTYSRDNFNIWIDADGNGCDTRQEVLISESLTKAKTGPGCKILSGTWLSPYDNQRFTNPSSLDIDHVIPLEEAWTSGASNWTSAKRQDFANDLDYSATLIAVSASANRSKGDRDPSEWMPSNPAYTCTYAVNWILVKYRWGLTADSAEIAALNANLAKCPSTTAVILPALGPGVTPRAVTPTAAPSATSNVIVAPMPSKSVGQPTSPTTSTTLPLVS
ncbi:MAG: hypothetical protein RJA35_1270, partial [Actinomycetota bacterium]